jgi:hypothetical protein
MVNTERRFVPRFKNWGFAPRMYQPEASGRAVPEPADFIERPEFDVIQGRHLKAAICEKSSKRGN